MSKPPAGKGLGKISPGEPTRLNIPGTSNDLDVGMAAAEVTPSNFLVEIRLDGLCPCSQE